MRNPMDVRDPRSRSWGRQYASWEEIEVIARRISDEMSRERHDE